MMNSIRVATIAFMLAIVHTPCADAQNNAAQSPEMKVLDRYVGSWEETVVNNPAAWTPEKIVTKAITKRQWILNGNMIENKGTWSPGDRTFLHLMTYDAQRKKYVQWYFPEESPSGQTYEGTWDAKTSTFTFNGMLVEGIHSTGQQKWIDRDTFTWTLKAKDSAGNVVLDMEGKCVRKK